MIEYNKELADKLAKDFEELTGIDLNDGSRKTEVMIARTLFYKILRDINVYNIYFNDRAEEFLTIEESKKKALKDIKYNINKKALSSDKDSLELIISTISKDRRDEVRELVSLRIKSWSWKGDDKCKIIEGGSSVEGYCF